MTPRIKTAVSIALLFAGATAAAAQLPPPPPPAPPGVVRDNTGPEPTGTGRMRGRVVDAETGAALQDTQLRLTGGGLREGRTSGTDDDGRFEFENLPAGRYTLSAAKPGYMTLAYGQRRAFESGRPIELADKQTLDGVDFAVPRGGVIVAHVTDENGEPLSDVRVMAQRFRFAGAQRTLMQVNPVFQGTDDRGELRVYGLPPGDYYVSASPVAFGPSGPALGAAGTGRFYVPTFYPGTPSVDGAQRVTVQVGKEVDVSFALVAARMARVSGVVRRADGLPGLRASVLVMGTGSTPTGRNAPVQPNGTFAVADLPPGEYSVQASFGTLQQADREQGRVMISVSGADVSGVVVPMSRGGTVRGRVSFERERPSNARVTVAWYPNVMAGPTLIGVPPVVADDDTFAIGGVFDEGMVRVSSLPAGWFLKAVRLGDRDVTDVPISVNSGGELAGVEIVLTQTRSEINGGAADAKGTAVNDYAVVVFPEDRSQWTTMSRFIATARPDQQGRFRLPGLPPGKYFAAAVDYIETGTERDPDLLERLRERATAVSLGEGEAKPVTLSIQ